LFALAALVLVATAVLPVGWLVVTSFGGPSGPTLDNYVTLFTEATMVRAWDGAGSRPSLSPGDPAQGYPEERLV